jgi:hypothetical protein
MQTLNNLPSTEYLRECLEFDPVMGKLCWKHRPCHHFTSTKEWKRWNTRFAGKDAGHKQRYYRIRLGESLFQGHRIIWKWMTGDEPPANIDHKNRP